MHTVVWRKACFDILNRLGVEHDCDRQTDGRTDILLANAALRYVARRKTVEQSKTVITI